MWRLVVRKYHLRTSHDTVRMMLCQMDPAGVAARQHHRLRRRTYSSRGPNDTWHVDGYDKLRPYGILINGYVNLLSSVAFVFIALLQYCSVKVIYVHMSAKSCYFTPISSNKLCEWLKCTTATKAIVL